MKYVIICHKIVDASHRILGFMLTNFISLLCAIYQHLGLCPQIKCKVIARTRLFKSNKPSGHSWERPPYIFFYMHSLSDPWLSVQRGWFSCTLKGECLCLIRWCNIALSCHSLGSCDDTISQQSTLQPRFCGLTHKDLRAFQLILH